MNSTRKKHDPHLDDDADILQEMFAKVVSAAQPSIYLAKHLPQPPKGRTILVGAGKAAASMAKAFDELWPHQLEGTVVTKTGSYIACPRVKVLEGSHPVPDQKSFEASQEIVRTVTNLTSDDLVVCLLSGGGSSLLCKAQSGISQLDFIDINKELLHSGASIHEINTVRQAVCCLKSGGLAEAAYPAKVVTLAISDIPGDDPGTIASGPTYPATIDHHRVEAILEKYHITPADSIRSYLKHYHATINAPRTMERGRPDFRVVITPGQCFQTAIDYAHAHGLNAIMLGDCLEGDATEVGKFLGSMALSVKRTGTPVSTPAVIFSGGETSVKFDSENMSQSRGGRNMQCLLALASYLKHEAGISAIMCDTDGIDGSSDCAGAIWTPHYRDLTKDQKLEMNKFLADCNSHVFFETIDALVRTGPTQTNINDFRAILIREA